MIDTHAHLYAKQFQNDTDAMMQRAFAAGIDTVFLPAIDSETHELMLAFEKKYPKNSHAMMGLHPCSVGADYEKELKIVERYLAERPFCAVGEIGIDLYWDKTFIEQQRKAFVKQMHYAEELKIPINIHTREAMDIVIDILAENKWYTQGGILHCFTGNVEQAQRTVDLGFYLGIGGVLTYKNSGLDAVVEKIDLKHLVLETDAPYLAPVPFRGKRNETSYVRYVAEKIAAIKNINLDDVERVTTANALNIYKTAVKV